MPAITITAIIYTKFLIVFLFYVQSFLSCINFVVISTFILTSNLFFHYINYIKFEEYDTISLDLDGDDGNIAKHFTENAKIGMIGVNVPIPVPVAYHSFGGWKRSLFGDHSMHGPEGVRFYTKLKTATVTWVEDDAGPEFSIPVLS